MPFVTKRHAVGSQTKVEWLFHASGEPHSKVRRQWEQNYGLDQDDTLEHTLPNFTGPYNIGC